MHSWEALEPIILKPAGVITAAFMGVAVQDFRAPAAYVNRIPYGRNTNREDALAVMSEGQGTCSTKHALLRRLALELRRFGTHREEAFAFLNVGPDLRRGTGPLRFSLPCLGFLFSLGASRGFSSGNLA